MANNTQHLTHHDVRPHIRNYVVNSFPVRGTNWDFEWYYDNGADTVEITLTINDATTVHHAPVLAVIGRA